jgi:membrane-bound lytic murein transglycosylase D
MPRSQVAAILVLLGTTLPGSAEELLPQPPALDPAVRFWTRVYTEVDSNAGLIHDDTHLDVVYEVIRFPPGLSERSRESRVKRAKSHIRSILRTLATGKRSGLTTEQARILSHWGPSVSDRTLREASHNIRFQLGQADKFLAGLVRSGAWRGHIEATLVDHGVPVELAALPHVESSYDPSAYSRVGAAGLWQFTRSTGRRYLRIDNAIDERLDAFLATNAAARLLRDNYRTTGTWPLAITSYNHGAAGMRRAAQRLGTRDIDQIVQRYKSRTFGFASRNFYTSFLAALHVDQDPERYFGPIQRDAPVDYAIIEMPHYYRATSLAAALGVDEGTLRAHNRALRPSVWNGSKYVPKGYALRIPRDRLALPAGQLLAQIPESERLGEQHRDRYHKVRRGETLSRIARHYGVSQRELVGLNGLRSRHRIRVGQVLVLPDRAGGEPVSIARQAPPTNGVYRVRRGDTLWTIAKRFGVSESELVAENGIRNRHRIAVGQSLRIPGAAASPPQPAPVIAAKPEPPQPAPLVVAEAESPLPAPLVVAEAESPPPAPEIAAEAEPSPPAPEIVALPPLRPEPRVADAEPTPEPEAEAALAASAETSPAAEPAVAGPALVAAAPAVASAAPYGSRPPDPSDYAVHGTRVRVQADETLGHYADWLEVRASHLRSINGMRYGQDLAIGSRLKLDFSRVTPEEFERRRLAYHRSLQEEFFDAWQVTGTDEHVLRRGETLWELATQRYRVPVWLLRQYNPDLDFAALPAGARMVVPRIEPRRG